MNELNLKDLSLPFSADQIEWRIAQAGKGQGGKPWAMCLAYIQARAIMDRLDEVCGPHGWKVDYFFVSSGANPTGGVMARLSIKVGDEWVTKEDGAEQTEIESFKGGLSSALKRAGSVWGIGRYLYDLESAFAEITDDRNARYGKTKDGTEFRWNPPQLPAWALPKTAPKPAPQNVAGSTIKTLDELNPKLKTRGTLGVDILNHGSKLGLSKQEVEKWAQDYAHVPANQMTLEQMEKFLIILQEECGRNGIIS